MQTKELSAAVGASRYPGRGIIAGMSADGKNAVAAYFIMGRSENSRNRVFCERENGDVYTAPFDPSKVSDPSLIIYNALRTSPSGLVVTNGDQTDTVCERMANGMTFSQSLEVREFEPDAPNLTPRISLLLSTPETGARYSLSILKSADEAGSGCSRYTFDYPAVAGRGHFIHTYDGDGNPLPSFTGEPEPVKIPAGIAEFTSAVWQGLDEDNKISLVVRFTDLTTGRYEQKIVNKNTEASE